jgi:hypothetical protein
MTVRKGLISVNEPSEGMKRSLLYGGIDHKRKGEIIDEEN